MWETQLQFTNSDYALDCERKEVLLEHVKLLYNNLRPEAVMEMPATQKQSKSERWFCEHWCRLTASRCPGAFKVRKLVSECQPNAAIEANKFIANQIWTFSDIMDALWPWKWTKSHNHVWNCHKDESIPYRILGQPLVPISWLFSRWHCWQWHCCRDQSIENLWAVQGRQLHAKTLQCLRMFLVGNALK